MSNSITREHIVSILKKHLTKVPTCWDDLNGNTDGEYGDDYFVESTDALTEILMEVGIIDKGFFDE